jgi:hypothetical protein
MTANENWSKHIQKTKYNTLKLAMTPKKEKQRTFTAAVNMPNRW